MHPIRTSTQSALGTVALRDGRVAQAVEAFTRVLDIETILQPDGGVDRALAHSNLAEALVAAERVAEARPHAEQALTELEQLLADDDFDLAYAHKAMGLVLLGEGRASEAGEQLERALALHTQAGNSGPELDELHELLARASAAGDQP
jgi:tetratricopeptide (TPR) repeat protein